MHSLNFMSKRSKGTKWQIICEPCAGCTFLWLQVSCCQGYCRKDGVKPSHIDIDLKVDIACNDEESHSARIRVLNCKTRICNTNAGVTYGIHFD